MSDPAARPDAAPQQATDLGDGGCPAVVSTAASLTADDTPGHDDLSPGAEKALRWSEDNRPSHQLTDNELRARVNLFTEDDPMREAKLPCGCYAANGAITAEAFLCDERHKQGQRVRQAQTDAPTLSEPEEAQPQSLPVGPDEGDKTGAQPASGSLSAGGSSQVDPKPAPEQATADAGSPRLGTGASGAAPESQPPDYVGDHPIESLNDVGFPGSPEAEYKVICECGWEAWNCPTKADAQAAHAIHVAARDEETRDAFFAAMDSLGTTEAGHSPRLPNPDPAVRLLEVEAERDQWRRISNARFDYAAEQRAWGERLEEALRAVKPFVMVASDVEQQHVETLTRARRLMDVALADAGGQAGPVAEREADLGDAAE